VNMLPFQMSFILRVGLGGGVVHEQRSTGFKVGAELETNPPYTWPIIASLGLFGMWLRQIVSVTHPRTLIVNKFPGDQNVFPTIPASFGGKCWAAILVNNNGSRTSYEFWMLTFNQYKYVNIIQAI
jgi:hypothetical protein